MEIAWSLASEVEESPCLYSFVRRPEDGDRAHVVVQVRSGLDTEDRASLWRGVSDAYAKFLDERGFSNVSEIDHVLAYEVSLRTSLDDYER